MKHIHIILLLVLGVTACNNAPKEKNDLEKDGLKGKVKSVQEVHSYNSYDLALMSSKYILYNQDGNRVEEKSWLDENGEYTITKSNKYNEKGLLIEEVSSYIGVDKKVFNYDTRGKMIEELSYSDDKLLKHKQYVYNDRGYVEKIIYLNNDSLQNSFTYDYYDNHKIKQCTEVLLHLNNKYKTIEESVYDMDENLIKKSSKRMLDSESDYWLTDFDGEYIYNENNTLYKLYY